MKVVFATSAGSLCIVDNMSEIVELQLNCQYVKCGREFSTTSLLSKYCCESHRVMQFHLGRQEITLPRNIASLNPTIISI